MRRTKDALIWRYTARPANIHQQLLYPQAYLREWRTTVHKATTAMAGMTDTIQYMAGWLAP